MCRRPVRKVKGPLAPPFLPITAAMNLHTTRDNSSETGLSWKKLGQRPEISFGEQLGHLVTQGDYQEDSKDPSLGHLEEGSGFRGSRSRSVNKTAKPEASHLQLTLAAHSCSVTPVHSEDSLGLITSESSLQDLASGRFMQSKQWGSRDYRLRLDKSQRELEGESEDLDHSDQNDGLGHFDAEGLPLAENWEPSGSFQHQGQLCKGPAQHLFHEVLRFGLRSGHTAAPRTDSSEFNFLSHSPSTTRTASPATLLVCGPDHLDVLLFL